MKGFSMAEAKIAKRKPANDEQGQIVQNRAPFELARELLKTDNEIDVANLEKILIIQERFDALQAKKAYNEAMTAFKANPPKIFKDKEVKFKTTKGTTQYKHARLSKATETINEALSQHGLTAAWIPSQNNENITITCRITHIKGHFEEASLTGPPDTSGNKNPLQAINSTVSYLERYTLFALTGLASYEQDGDGGEPDLQPTPMESAMIIVCEAFEQFQEIHKTSLAKGFVYDLDRFTKAIQKHWKRLPNGKPSKEANIQKILETIKPEEVIVEHANVSSEINN
jgi:hypothetical protein